MFKHFHDRKRKGQSTLEYAILIIIIIAALITIQSYIKRGIQGRLRSATDDIGDQFDPGNTMATVTTSTSSTTQEINVGGNLTTNLIGDEVTDTTANTSIVNGQMTFWATNP